MCVVPGRLVMPTDDIGCLCVIVCCAWVVFRVWHTYIGNSDIFLSLWSFWSLLHFIWIFWSFSEFWNNDLLALIPWHASFHFISALLRAFPWGIYHVWSCHMVVPCVITGHRLSYCIIPIICWHVVVWLVRISIYASQQLLISSILPCRNPAPCVN